LEKLARLEFKNMVNGQLQGILKKGSAELTL